MIYMIIGTKIITLELKMKKNYSSYYLAKEKTMKEIYCIIQREVNKETGEINARVCEKGTIYEIFDSLSYYKIRSIFNQELSYYLVLQENEKEAIEILGNSIVKESNLYAKIR